MQIFDIKNPASENPLFSSDCISGIWVRNMVVVPFYSNSFAFWEYNYWRLFRKFAPEYVKIFQ